MDAEGETCYENHEPTKVTETQNVYSPLEVKRQELVYDSLNNRRVAVKPLPFCDLSNIWKWVPLSFGIIAVCLSIAVVCLSLLLQCNNKTYEDRTALIKGTADVEIDQSKGFSCGIVTCANGGSCYDCCGGFRCYCSSGFTGITCQEKTHCSSSPCRYSEHCVEARDSYKCVLQSEDRYHRYFYRHRCRGDWFLGDDMSTCNWISDYPANWTTAATACQRKRAHLIQIHSLKDIETIKSRVNESVWVGGSLIEDQYTWQNEAMYVHRQSDLWTKCEPNGDICMKLWYKEGSFFLDDDKCEEEYIFVCQYRM